MYVEKTDRNLSVCLIRDFNLLTARKIEKLAKDAQTVCIDLKNSRFVESEAIKVLYKWMKEGKMVRLRNPPELFFEVIAVLGLGQLLHLDELVESSHSGSHIYPP